MTLLKRQGPLILCFLLGVAFFLQYYIPHPLSQKALTHVNEWVLISSGFAVLLGISSLVQVHSGKIARKASGWGYSVVVFVSLLATFAVGLWSRGNDFDAGNRMTAQGWIYTYMLNPLQATIFATLGFYVASAAFRTFRLKSLEAGILMAAALILLFGRIPLGEFLWSKVAGYDAAEAARSARSMNSVTEWVMTVPSMAGRRGVLLGITLGAIATSLKIILGIERAYLGGGKD